MTAPSDSSQVETRRVAPAGATVRLNSVEEESAGFRRLRRRVVRSSLRQTLQTARLRVIVVSVLSVLFWCGLFFLFYEGFHFLATFIGLSGQWHANTVHFIYNAFFASLMVMLIFSSGIILYGGLYRSREVGLLLTLPVRPERIVYYKFQEAHLFSSWGFFLLGSPLLIAYGVSVGAPWHYYAMFLPFILAFAYIPCSIGAIACLIIVYWIPRVRTLTVGLCACIAIGAASYSLWSLLVTPGHGLLTERWFEETFARLQFTKLRLLPSWWLSTGLLEAARSTRHGPRDYPLAQSVMFMVLLVANAMFLHLIMMGLARRNFRASYSLLHGNEQRSLDHTFFGRWYAGLKSVLATKSAPRSAVKDPGPRPAWIDRVAMAVTFPLGHQVRLMIVKDLRVFRRDPVQWTQFLIFFGLLALYFVNIRRFDYDAAFVGWVNMVSFLNLAVVGLILSTFTTRFIYPMISLEGSRFWILGLLPMDRDAILWGKFLFAGIGSVIPCTLLILLSDLMLEIDWSVVAIHQITCVILCIGLSGIAVGLGARMPDLREQSPSKIAAGFGGTLNLVLSAIYIVTVVLLTALPCHFYVALEQAEATQGTIDVGTLRNWMFAGIGGAVVLGIVATVVPLRIGFRAFRALEF